MFGKYKISSSSAVRMWKVGVLFVSAYLLGFVLAYIYINQTESLGSEECPCHQRGDVEDKIEARIEKQAVIQLDEDVIAESLYNGVRVLCVILTSPQNLHHVTSNIKATWGRRCNKIIYISSHYDPTFPTVRVDVPEGRDYLWQKERGGFQYVYDHHLQDAEWFLKADDDTYVIVENLRYLLASFNPNEAMYFGRKFKHDNLKQVYMSGGAGYVMSRSALVLLVEKAFKNPDLCRLEGSSEDIEMGRCLEGVGVLAGDSRDSLLQDRFHPFNPHILLIPGVMSEGFWFLKYVFYPTRSGPECCSDYSISFHYISPNTMYLLEYMIYHMRPFGIGHYTCPANIDTILKKKQPPADEKLKVKVAEVKGKEGSKSKEKREISMLME